MHIGFLTSDLTTKHGWGNYSLSVIRALQKLGVKLTILTANNSDVPEDLTIHPVLPAVAPAQQFFIANSLLAVPSTANLLKNCDIIHSTIESYAPLAAAIAGNRPLFITAHGSYVNLPKIRRWPINSLYRRAFQKSTLVCVSQYTAKIAQNLIPDIRTAIIPNAVDATRFANLPDVSQNKTHPTIISSGGVKARKGTLQLVRAVAKVCETIPDVQCMIIGNTEVEPNYTQQVLAEIEKLQLQNTVKLLGFVDEKTLLYWYAMGDVFVLPSINAGWKFEGFGLATFEASAAGLPVIGTTDCGAEQAIEHGITGLLVNQAQVEEELPEAIIEILNNSEKAQRMGLAGKQKAQSQTWDKVAQELMSLYKKG